MNTQTFAIVAASAVVGIGTFMYIRKVNASKLPYANASMRLKPTEAEQLEFEQEGLTEYKSGYNPYFGGKTKNKIKNKIKNKTKTKRKK